MRTSADARRPARPLPAISAAERRAMSARDGDSTQAGVRPAGAADDRGLDAPRLAERDELPRERADERVHARARALRAQALGARHRPGEQIVALGHGEEGRDVVVERQQEAQAVDARRCRRVRRGRPGATPSLRCARRAQAGPAGVANTISSTSVAPCAACRRARRASVIRRWYGPRGRSSSSAVTGRAPLPPVATPRSRARRRRASPRGPGARAGAPPGRAAGRAPPRRRAAGRRRTSRPA